MNPIKFRCYRCNQLLGVSRHKAGEVVGCPRCLAELVVPDPDGTETAPETEGLSALEEPTPFFAELPSDLATPTPPDGPAPGVPLGFPDLRPEDLRAEPGTGPGASATAPQPPRVAATVVMSSVAAAPAPVAAEGPTELPQAVSQIQVDAPSKKVQPRHSPVTVRSRDLVIPRSVVASWSLFVLLAQAAAFLAGLLAGHYVWRVH